MSNMNAKRRPRRNRRGIRTRQDLIQGTIRCLHTYGYAQTTIELIISETRYGRGSVLHQFPTRLDLITAAIEAAMDEALEDVRVRFSSIPNEVQAYQATCDILWESLNMPQSIAVTEALWAARWDKDLARALRPIGQRVELEIDQLIGRIAIAAGANKINECLVQSRILIVSLRGMVIELAYSPDRDIMRQALDRMRLQHREHCNDVLGPEETRE